MISISASGGYDVLAYKALGETETTRGANVKDEDEDLLVTVETIACGINYAEVLIRYGCYKSATDMVGYPITPGFEFSGKVSKVGSKVEKFNVGDIVFGVTLFGGYSGRIVVPEKQLFEIPKGMTPTEASGFSCVALTAWYAIRECCKVRPGYRVLIHSAAGGVGSMLVQMAKMLECFVVGVVGSSHKVEVAKELGCDVVIDKSTTDLWPEAERVAPGGYRAVFDANGVATLAGSYSHLSPGGRLVSYGFHSMMPRSTEKGVGKIGVFKAMQLGLAYMKTPSFSPLDMCSANKSVMSFNLSYMFDEMDLIEESMNELLSWYKDGRLKVPKVTEYPLKNVGEAHRALESGKTVGKLVLLSDITDDKQQKEDA